MGLGTWLKWFAAQWVPDVSKKELGKEFSVDLE
jgi:hypothetical protein